MAKLWCTRLISAGLLLAPLSGNAWVHNLTGSRSTANGASFNYAATGQKNSPLVANSLRTDLRGTSISVELPENAPDQAWNDEVMHRFEQITGIHVNILRPGNDTTVVLKDYMNQFRSGAPKADVYAIDIVWPSLLAQDAEDLRPVFSELGEFAPQLIGNDTVDGKLVALPYFVEVSLLYYRTDLLRKYGFARPPRTWRELEDQARLIQAGERANGKRNFWGYLWQGAPSEALTCNALEWQVSEGGGALLNNQGTLDFATRIAAASWNRARRWVGTISPPSVLGHLEDDSLKIWKNGDASFMRNWPYAYEESIKTDSRVKGKVAVSLLPMGEGRNGRHADTLGGFQLMISKRSQHKQAAIELLKFLTSPESQRLNAVTRGYAPVTMHLYTDPTVLHSAAFLTVVHKTLLGGALARPSAISGGKYDALSSAFFTNVHSSLMGDVSAASAAEKLKHDLQTLLGDNATGLNRDVEKHVQKTNRNRSKGIKPASTMDSGERDESNKANRTPPAAKTRLP
jgi:trehalose/maltose transport system substrate-binding protein